MTGDTHWLTEFVPSNWAARIDSLDDLTAAHRRWSEARRNWMAENFPRDVDVESADFFEGKALEYALADYEREWLL
jgi:hypothetical protein